MAKKKRRKQIKKYFFHVSSLHNLLGQKFSSTSDYVCGDGKEISIKTKVSVYPNEVLSDFSIFLDKN
jgi:hypothetical protein